jgi:hypothetical protein
MKEYKNLPETEPCVVCEPAIPAFKIPRDENGKPIGTPWEVIRERMYDDLSKHYGVDLRTL